MIFKRNHLFILALIILFAALLRVPAARFAAPYSYYWDESSYLNASHRMLSHQSLKYSWFNVPPFYLFQQAPVNLAHYWWAISANKLQTLIQVEIKTDAIDRNITPSSLLVFCRLYTVFLSLCTVFLVYRIGARAMSRDAGLIGALLLAVSPGFIEHSLFVTLDLPLAFMAALTVYASLTMSDNPTRKACGLTSALAGLTAATKYNGAMIWLLPLAIHIKHYGWLGINSRLLVILSTIFIAFSLGCPWWNELDHFIRQVSVELQHYGSDIEYLTGPSMYGWAFVQSWMLGGFGAAPMLASIGGLCLFIQSRNRYRTAVLTFPIAYFAMLAIQQSDFVRNAVAMLPFWALFAGYSIAQLSKRLAAYTQLSQKGVLASTVVLFCLQPIIQGGLLSWNLSHLTDTRTQVINWLNTNTPKGGVVLIDENLAIHPEDLERAKFQFQIAPVEDWPKLDIHAYTSLLTAHQFVIEDVVKEWRYQARQWKNNPYDLHRELKHKPLPLHLAKSLQQVEKVNKYLFQMRVVHQIAPEYEFPYWTSLSLFDAGASYLGRSSINPNIAVYRPLD